MPPKPKITREMITEAGLDIIRAEGADALNVRRVAAELGCSTQPVMYHYRTMEELKNELYSAADRLHSEELMAGTESSETPMLDIGLNYIAFAAREKHLFRFLFQSDKFRSSSFQDMMNGEELMFLLTPLRDAAGLDETRAREVFSGLFACVHGLASLIANNSMEYDREAFSGLLTMTFYGSVGYIKGGGEK